MLKRELVELLYSREQEVIALNKELETLRNRGLFKRILNAS